MDLEVDWLGSSPNLSNSPFLAEMGSIPIEKVNIFKIMMYIFNLNVKQVKFKTRLSYSTQERGHEGIRWDPDPPQE